MTPQGGGVARKGGSMESTKVPSVFTRAYVYAAEDERVSQENALAKMRQLVVCTPQLYETNDNPTTTESIRKHEDNHTG